MFESKGWSETDLEKRPQCTYMNEVGEVFIVRQYGEYEWFAISISVKQFFSGQIIAKGQSDIDAYNRAIKEIDNGKERAKSNQNSK